MIFAEIKGLQKKQNYFGKITGDLSNEDEQINGGAEHRDPATS